MKRCDHPWKPLLSKGHPACSEVVSWCPVCGCYKKELHFPMPSRMLHLNESSYKETSQTEEFERPKAARDSELQWHRYVLDAFKKTAQDYAKHKCWDWGDKKTKKDCGICPPCRARSDLQLLKED